MLHARHRERGHRHLRWCLALTQSKDRRADAVQRNRNARRRFPPGKHSRSMHVEEVLDVVRSSRIDVRFPRG